MHIYCIKMQFNYLILNLIRADELRIINMPVKNWVPFQRIKCFSICLIRWFNIRQSVLNILFCYNLLLIDFEIIFQNGPRNMDLLRFEALQSNYTHECGQWDWDLHLKVNFAPLRAPSHDLVSPPSVLGIVDSKTSIHSFRPLSQPVTWNNLFYVKVSLKINFVFNVFDI